MTSNELTIIIRKPLKTVFDFTITPPNSTLWIPGIIDELTNEWPIRIGTIYVLTNDRAEVFKVKVENFREDKLVEWVAEDDDYHCRYEYNALDESTTELTYKEMG